MPVHKYKSVSDMPPPTPARQERLSDRIRALWNRAFLLSPAYFVRGVTRFKSLDEANAMRISNTIERMRRSSVLAQRKHDAR
jgi:hypothetical protein